MVSYSSVWVPPHLPLKVYYATFTKKVKVTRKISTLKWCFLHAYTIYAVKVIKTQFWDILYYIIVLIDLTFNLI